MWQHQNNTPFPVDFCSIMVTDIHMGVSPPGLRSAYGMQELPPRRHNEKPNTLNKPSTWNSEYAYKNENIRNIPTSDYGSNYRDINYTENCMRNIAGYNDIVTTNNKQELIYQVIDTLKAFLR